MSNNNAEEIAAFMNELEETRPARTGTGRRGATYDILKPEFGQIYRNYAILSFNHGTSPLGADSVVVRMVNMDTGRRERFTSNPTKSKTGTVSSRTTKS